VNKKVMFIEKVKKLPVIFGMFESCIQRSKDCQETASQSSMFVLKLVRATQAISLSLLLASSQRTFRLRAAIRDLARPQARSPSEPERFRAMRQATRA
jgi:hypothetical protein